MASLATVAKDTMTSSKMVDTATVTSQDGDRCQRPIMCFIMKKTGDKKAVTRIILSPNPNTLCCKLEVLDAKYQVNFDEDDSLYTVLRFDRKVYKVGQHGSERFVNILSVNSILVHCNVIESSRLNGIESSIIYTFFTDAAPGDKIIIIPRHLIYIPFTLNVISRMMC